MPSLIDPLIYSSYEKMTDDLYWISSNLLLRFNVILAHYDKEGNRVGFHKEFKYPTNKTSYGYLKSIRRDFDFYLSIENFYRRNGEDRIFIPINVQDIISVRMALQVVFSWYNDKQYEGLYVTKNGKLMMTSPAPSYIIQMPGANYIEFKPIILEKKTGVDDKEPGVFMGINDNDGSRLTLRNFMGLKYLIDSINMYEVALLMLNYLGRPEFGSFMYSFSSEDTVEENGGNVWERKDKLNINTLNTMKNSVSKSPKRFLPGSKILKSIESLEGEE